MDTCQVVKWVTRIGRRDLAITEPRGHFGCTVTLIGHKLWVIGGSNGMHSVFLLDVNSRMWEPVRLRINIEGADRAVYRLHTACLYEDSIYLHGVTASSQVNGEYQNRNLDELVRIDTALQELQVVPTYSEDDGLSFKFGHTANTCERLGVMALFGGHAPLGNSLWILHLSSRKWTRAKTKGGVPSPRMKHAACLEKTILFVYHGGRTGAVTTDFFMIDLAPSSRSKVLVWHKLDLMAGTERYGRMGAAMAYIGSGRIIVFGGYQRIANTNSLMVIDNVFSSARTCREVTLAGLDPQQGEVIEHLRYVGDPPSPREGPRMVVTQDKVYVVGGKSSDKLNYFELVPY